jgi:hypothetical protein
MNKRRILLLGSVMVFLLACGLPFSSGGDTSKVFSEKVEKYPVAYDGSMTASTPYDAATCVRTGTAHFVANDDLTCAIIVSFPETYTDTKGQCVNMSDGSTQAWLLEGTFARAAQVCHFERCNQNNDYYGSGTLSFTPQEAAPATLTCTLASKSRLEVTIRTDALAPAK